MAKKMQLNTDVYVWETYASEKKVVTLSIEVSKRDTPYAKLQSTLELTVKQFEELYQQMKSVRKELKESN